MKRGIAIILIAAIICVGVLALYYRTMSDSFGRRLLVAVTSTIFGAIAKEEFDIIKRGFTRKKSKGNTSDDNENI